MKLKTIGIKARDQELALERLMVLSAPNGSGKSTFTEAIRFLALGYIPSLGKRPHDTAVVMREPSISATLTLNDGRVITRSLEETDTGFHARAECSWLQSHGVQRHSREILSLFGRDEQDVAEALDIRQLLNAGAHQREARIAGLLSASRSTPEAKLARIRALLLGRPAHPDPSALAAAMGRLEALLRDSGTAGALGWAAEERRRAASLVLQKSKAREELQARIAPLASADGDQIRRLEAERERLERELGALEEKALQVRLREEQSERLARTLDAARAACDEAVAERRRWEARALDLAHVPEDLLRLEEELDRLEAPRFQEPAAPAALRAEADAIVLPEIPDLVSVGRRLDALEAEEGAIAESPWNEVADLAESIRTLSKSRAGSPMVEILVHAQRLSQLARQALRTAATALRRRQAEQRARAERLRNETEERAAERIEAAARQTSLRAEADRIGQEARDAYARAQAGFEEQRLELLRRRDTLRRTLQALSTEDRRTTAALDKAQLFVESLERERSELRSLADEGVPPETEVHRALHDVRRELASLGVVQTGRGELDRLAQEESGARGSRDLYAGLEWSLQRLQEEEIMESREQITAILASLLHEAGRTETPFFTAAHGAFRIGWRTSAGKEIPVQSLSGGEWILFAAGLAATVLILRNAPLRILLVEAGEADAHTLSALLDGLRSVGERLTCTLVLTPRAVAAPGWTVVKRFGPAAVAAR